MPAVADAIRIVRDNSGDTQPPLPINFTYQYDPNGNLSDIADGSPNAQFTDYTPTFDNLSQLTQVLEKTAAGTQHTLTYRYDLAGNVTSQSLDAPSNTNSYTYNTLNELAQVVNNESSALPGTITTGYTYTPTGQIATETKGNGNFVINTYNDDLSLAGSTEVASGGTLVDQHSFEYDANDNITTDSLTLQNASGGANFNRTSTLAYDPNNQVKSVTNSDNKDNQAYQYDSSGNVIEQTINGAKAGFTYTHDRLVQWSDLSNGFVPTGTYIYDTLGRLNDVANGYSNGVTGTVGQRYNYDGFDNIILQSQDTGTATSTTTASYDSLNRAITETISGDGTSQTDTPQYLGTSKTVASDSINFGTGTDTKVYDYSATGERLAMFDSESSDTGPSNETGYYTYNQHQDVEALTDGTTGSTIATYGYTAYGADDPSHDSGLDAGISGLPVFPFNSYRFNSGRVNNPTGNLDMGFRTYDPNINRFISRDSFNASGTDMGIAGGNRYAFAGGNPISNIEQNGHDWLSILGGIAGAALVIGGCALAGVATAGVAAFACAVGAGVVGGLAAQGVTCGENGGSSCSPGAFAVSGAVAGVAAAVTFGLGSVLSGSLSGWAAGGIAAVAGGDVGYGISCAIASNCSWVGLAETTALAGVTGAIFGAARGGEGGVPEDVTPDADLGTRAGAVQSALRTATAKRTTTAVLRAYTASGEARIIVATSEQYFRSAWLQALTDDEIAVAGPNDAEVNALAAARQLGLRPGEIGASRPVCFGCYRAFELSRGRYVTCLPCVVDLTVEAAPPGDRRSADWDHVVTEWRASLPGYEKRGPDDPDL